MLNIFVEHGAKPMKILELHYQMIQFLIIPHKIGFFSVIVIHSWSITICQINFT